MRQKGLKMPLSNELNAFKNIDGSVRFPSLKLGGLLWERALNLTELRAKAVQLTRIDQLATGRQNEEARQSAALRSLAESEAIDPVAGAIIFSHQLAAESAERAASVVDAINKLVGPLELDQSNVDQLIIDAKLVRLFDLLPTHLREISFDNTDGLAALKTMKNKSHAIAQTLFMYAPAIEQLMSTFPLTSSSSTDDPDVMALASTLTIFVRRADEIIELSQTGKGSATNAHRDRTLALVILAVEEATGDKIRISRDTAERDGIHFTGKGARFVVGLMRMIGHKNEATLAAACLRMVARQPSHQEQ